MLWWALECGTWSDKLWDICHNIVGHHHCGNKHTSPHWGRILLVLYWLFQMKCCLYNAMLTTMWAEHSQSHMLPVPLLHSRRYWLHPVKIIVHTLQNYNFCNEKPKRHQNDMMALYKWEFFHCMYDQLVYLGASTYYAILIKPLSVKKPGVNIQEGTAEHRHLFSMTTVGQLISWLKTGT